MNNDSLAATLNALTPSQLHDIQCAAGTLLAYVHDGAQPKNVAALTMLALRTRQMTEIGVRISDRAALEFIQSFEAGVL